jgi:hypothetical protein
LPLPGKYYIEIMGDSGNAKGLTGTWSTDLLASRLQADRTQTTGLKPVNGKTTRTLNTRMMRSSQSAPSLKPASSLTGLERSANLKSSKLLTTDRSIVGPALLAASSKKSIAHTIQVEQDIDDSQSNNHDDGVKSPTTASFLESLNLTPKLHHELFHVPHTFFYLEAKTAVDTKAYDLQLISQDKVDKNQYYTISKEGITLHRSNDSEFTSLSQWEREYNLFHQISVIPFFRQYRRWKVCSCSYVHSSQFMIVHL